MGLKCFQSTSDVVKSYIINLNANLLANSALLGLYNFQSSVNVEDGIGTISFAVFSASTIVCTMFIIPFLKHIVTPKTGILFAYIAAAAYIVLNFKPSFASLIFANLVNGLGRSMFFVYSCFFTVYYAKQFTRFGRENFVYYFKITNGCFFCALLSGQIFGNLIPFIVFEIFSATYNSPTSNKTTYSPATSNLTTASQPLRFSVSDVCGANDCQDPLVTAANLSNYLPPSQTSYYIVLGIYVGLALVSALTHYVFIPSARSKPKEPTTEPTRNSIDKKVSITYRNEAFVKDCNSNHKVCHLNNNNNNECNDIINISSFDREHSAKIDNVIDRDSEHTSVNSDVVPEEKKLAKLFKIWLKETKNIFKFCFTFHQFLMFFISFNSGLQQSFVLSEMTRAYVSCVYGVAEIGRSMMVYGIAAFIFSLLIGKASGKFGSRILVGVVFLINCSFYILCLLWIPDENASLAPLYGLVVLSGISDSTSQAISSEVTVLHFSSDCEKALSAWMIWSSVGFIVQFSWSTSVCVNYKLYAMFGTLTLGVLTYGIAEMKYMKKQSPQGSVEEITKM